jgi:DNA uptake protein ComE-like DNA-binding protein
MIVMMAVMAGTLHRNSKIKGRGRAVSNALLQTFGEGLRMDLMPGRLRWTLLFAAMLCVAVAVSAQRVDGQPAPAAHASLAPAAHASLAPGERVDINHASVEELEKVPGMTGTWAARIVRFRPYRSKQDLLDKGVVTSGVYDRIKDSVVAHRDKQ